jgi:hypothetical protein
MILDDEVDAHAHLHVAHLALSETTSETTTTHIVMRDEAAPTVAMPENENDHSHQDQAADFPRPKLVHMAYQIIGRPWSVE